MPLRKEGGERLLNEGRIATFAEALGSWNFDEVRARKSVNISPQISWTLISSSGCRLPLDAPNTLLPYASVGDSWVHESGVGGTGGGGEAGITDGEK